MPIGLAASLTCDCVKNRVVKKAKLLGNAQLVSLSYPGQPCFPPFVRATLKEGAHENLSGTMFGFLFGRFNNSFHVLQTMFALGIYHYSTFMPRGLSKWKLEMINPSKGPKGLRATGRRSLCQPSTLAVCHKATKGIALKKSEENCWFPSNNDWTLGSSGILLAPSCLKLVAEVGQKSTKQQPREGETRSWSKACSLVDSDWTGALWFYYGPLLVASKGVYSLALWAMKAVNTSLPQWNL